MGHAEKTALRYYDVHGTSGTNKRIAGFASLDRQRTRLERSGEDTESDSDDTDLVPDSRPTSPSLLPLPSDSSSIPTSDSEPVAIPETPSPPAAAASPGPEEPPPPIASTAPGPQEPPPPATPTAPGPQEPPPPIASAAPAVAPRFQGTPGQRALWSGPETRILENAAGEMLRSGRFCWEILKNKPGVSSLQKTEKQIIDKFKYMRKLYRKRQVSESASASAM